MTQTEEPLVQLATRLPKSLMRELKVHVVRTDQKVMDFCIKALRNQLKKEAGK